MPSLINVREMENAKGLKNVTELNNVKALNQPVLSNDLSRNKHHPSSFQSHRESLFNAAIPHNIEMSPPSRNNPKKGYFFLAMRLFNRVMASK